MLKDNYLAIRLLDYLSRNEVKRIHNYGSIARHLTSLIYI